VERLVLADLVRDGTTTPDGRADSSGYMEIVPARTPDGNVLWDCIPLLDDATVAEIRRRGPL